MVERKPISMPTDHGPEARQQAQSLADSIDAAAWDLAENGPVSAAELAAVLAELEAEWAEEAVADPLQICSSSR
jgi:hypothetical protein